MLVVQCPSYDFPTSQYVIMRHGGTQNYACLSYRETPEWIANALGLRGNRVSEVIEGGRPNPRYAHLGDRQLSRLVANIVGEEENERNVDQEHKGKIETDKALEPSSRSIEGKSDLSAHDELLSHATGAGKQGIPGRGDKDVTKPATRSDKLADTDTKNSRWRSLLTQDTRKRGPIRRSGAFPESRNSDF